MAVGNKLLRVMLIDPWGTNNTSEYLNGLIYGFSGIVELDVFTNYYFNQYVESSVSVKKIFFKKEYTLFFNKITYFSYNYLS